MTFSFKPTADNEVPLNIRISLALSKRISEATAGSQISRSEFARQALTYALDHMGQETDDA